LVTDPRSDPLTALQIDESLSMAFLVLLERLTPVSVQSFLCTKSHYKHTEIAETLGQSEANCRQILRRARQRVGDVGRRFKASAEERNDLRERFSSGNPQRRDGMA